MQCHSSRHQVDRHKKKAFEEDPMQVRSHIVVREFKRGDRPDLYAGISSLVVLRGIVSTSQNRWHTFSIIHVVACRAYFHAKTQRLVLMTEEESMLEQLTSGTSQQLGVQNLFRHAVIPEGMYTTSWSQSSQAH